MSGLWLRVRGVLLPGDGRIWLTAAAVLGVGAVIALVALSTPRELLLGSNSVSSRADIAEIPAGGRMCVRGQEVPSGTGRIRFKLDSQARRQPPYDLAVRLGTGEALRGHLPAGAPGFRYVEIPLSRTVPNTPAGYVPATICLRAGDTGGAVYPWGTPQLDNTTPPLRVAGPNGSTREYTNRVALWYLPRSEEKRSLLAQAPTIFARASLFRPGFVGAWLYWTLFVVVLPVLAYGAIRLLALGSTARRLRLDGALAVLALGFCVSLTWAVVTPTFQSPDESEHFAAVQWFGETGKAVDSAPGKRIQWSTDEALAIDATHELSVIERPEAKLPWLPQIEKTYDTQRARERPPKDNGGGFHPVTSSHTPLYYAIESPAYRATRGSSVFSQLFAMRVVSAAMAGFTAMFAALLVLELLPGRRVLAIAAGLLVAFQPMFSFIGGSVNNDNGVNLLASISIYLAIRVLRRGLSPAAGVLLGVALAFTPLMKGTGYAIYPSVMLAVGASLMRDHKGRHRLGLASLAAGFLAVYVGWDLVRETFGRSQFTTPGGGTPGVSFGARDHPKAYLVWLWQVLVPIKLPFMQDFTLVKWPFYNIYVERGFGSYGWYAIQFPRWVYLTVVAVMGCAGALLVRAAFLHRAVLRTRIWELIVIVSIPVIVFCGVEAAYFTLAIPVDGTAEQGRYIFTAIAPLAASAVLACSGLKRRSELLAVALVAGIVVLTAAGQMLSLAAFYS